MVDIDLWYFTLNADLIVQQLVIEATDQGVPERVITMTVYIEVDRSTRGPRFNDIPYNRHNLWIWP